MNGAGKRIVELPPVGRPCWTYLVVYIDEREVPGELDKLGRDGWELVCMYYTKFVFKRAILVPVEYP